MREVALAEGRVEGLLNAKRNSLLQSLGAEIPVQRPRRAIGVVQGVLIVTGMLRPQAIRRRQPAGIVVRHVEGAHVGARLHPVRFYGDALSWSLPYQIAIADLIGVFPQFGTDTGIATGASNLGTRSFRPNAGKENKYCECG